MGRASQRSLERIAKMRAQPAPGPGEVACTDCRAPVAVGDDPTAIRCPGCGLWQWLTPDGRASRWPTGWQPQLDAGWRWRDRTLRPPGEVR